MKKLLFFIALILIPIGLSAQDNVENALIFLEGGDVLEDWFMKDFLGGYREILSGRSQIYVDIAKAVGGGFAIIYFSMVAWNMMTGDKELKILPLLKPFGILMLILNWQLFIDIVNEPFERLASISEQEYVKTVQENRNLRISRYQYQMLVADALATTEAENEIASETAKDGFLKNPIKEVGEKAIDLVVKPILAFKAKITTSIQLIVTQLLELLALWILRICVYVIFAIQIIFSAILVFLGPISLAFTILPMFSNAFKYWLSRYISVQFYLTVAFLILTVCGNLQKIAYMQEIDRYKALINLTGTPSGDGGALLSFFSNGILSFGIVIVVFLVSAISIMMVPKVSTWIIPSGGTSGLMGGVSRGASMVVTKGAMLLK